MFVLLDGLELGSRPEGKQWANRGLAVVRFGPLFGIVAKSALLVNGFSHVGNGPSGKLVLPDGVSVPVIHFSSSIS